MYVQGRRSDQRAGGCERAKESDERNAEREEMRFSVKEGAPGE